MGWTSVLNIDGSRLAVGRVGALCGNVHAVHGPAWITDNALCISVDRWFEKDYLALTLKARNLNDLADKNAQPLITGTKIKAEKLPAPPISEQGRILKQVSDFTYGSEALVQRNALQIEKLSEYRQALITAAATGQLDIEAAA
jgi:type I restriction enzyme, S subunit